MKIKTVKIIPADGVESRKIISFEGVLELSALPERYRLENPCFFKEAYEEVIILLDFNTREEITPGKIIPESKFQQMVSTMRECGNRLHEVNEKIRERRREWHGEEIIEI